MKRLCGDITEDSAYILYEGQRVGTITHRVNECDEEEYVFRVDWEAYDRIKPSAGITGLNMELRKDEYVRDHVPSFIYDTIPPVNRENIKKVLDKYGLKYYDPWELLLATKRYTNDGYTVEHIERRE